MTVTHQSLEAIDQHWAVSAAGTERRDRAAEVAKHRLVQAAVGQQIRLDFQEVPEDETLLERLATAYEIASAEGIHALIHPSSGEENDRLRDQAQAGAFRAFELRRVMRISTDPEARVFHVLHLAALAYSGDRWADMRRWLKEHHDETTPPSAANALWDRRVLFRLYECWIRLVRKDGWDDLDGIREVIAGLREDQRAYESQLLESEHDSAAQALAFRLIALYHWAKATELLAVFILQGQPPAIAPELDKHFEAATGAASASRDPLLEMLLRWLHIAARRMASGSLWAVAHAVNSRVTRFVTSVTKSGSLFELLPPQRAALQEQGLLDQASRAIVVDMPTSGGKTALAQFRILQALNQFDAEHGWVAYVVPTRALVTQITRRLRSDFSPLDINVEQLTAAVEIDSFEQRLLADPDGENSFHVLVATPEKLNLVIRNKAIERPLALVVMDEAHNIEDEERGLRIELLLATIKRDCPSANFLLLSPNVPNAEDLARWLAPEAGKTISLGSSAWQPNERIVGMFGVKREPRRGDWSLTFQTLTTTPRTIRLEGLHQVGAVKPLGLPYSKAKSATTSAGAMAKVLSERGTSIAVAGTIARAWEMARTIARSLDSLPAVPPEIGLVQRFLATEISPQFELIELLNKGVAVHHAGISDEARSLIEWLAERGQLRVLCATTTIAQGINFPVSSVFLATRFHPYGKEMTTRAFWNLAGRAGRFEHDSVGVVGLAEGSDPDAVRSYVSRATGDLVSRLVSLLDQIDAQGELHQLSTVIQAEQWADFRSYVAHLWREKQNLDAVLAETEQLLRNTFGYGVLQARQDESARSKAHALLEATKRYAESLAAHPENATLADATGFAPEGVAQALLGLGGLENRLTTDDWQPASLFGSAGSSALPQLVGVMLRIPEIRESLKELGSHGTDLRHIAELTQAWVGGASIEEIARKFFSGGKDLTEQITAACKGIYRVLANSATWGLSALSKMPTSGIDFSALPEDAQRAINSLPAMIYHGVRTEPAVLMRMNGVPRSVAEDLGAEFEAQSEQNTRSVRAAREFIRSLSDGDWQRAAPSQAAMSGEDYRAIWARLSGTSLGE